MRWCMKREKVVKEYRFVVSLPAPTDRQVRELISSPRTVLLQRTWPRLAYLDLDLVRVQPTGSYPDLETAIRCGMAKRNDCASRFQPVL